MTGLNRNTVDRFHHSLHQRIYAASEAERPIFGVVEIDESLFGPGRVKGKRNRGAYGKITVFGFLNAMDRFIQQLFLIARKPGYRAL